MRQEFSCLDLESRLRMESCPGELTGPVRRDFTSTHWSLVLSAAANQDTEAVAALDRLCRQYWYPLYAFVRRNGYSHHDAEDLTQAFFRRIIEKHCLRHVHPSKGRFRTFLLAAMQNFLANESDKARTLKRGGQCRFESLDGLAADERYAREPKDGWTPEMLYERRWALTLLEQSLKRLREEYYESGDGEVFEMLRDHLVPGGPAVPYAVVAERLGKSAEAVAMGVFRMRRRYRECLRQEIASTVGDQGDIDSEIRDLLSVIGR